LPVLSAARIGVSTEWTGVRFRPWY